MRTLFRGALFFFSLMLFSKAVLADDKCSSQIVGYDSLFSCAGKRVKIYATRPNAVVKTKFRKYWEMVELPPPRIPYVVWIDGKNALLDLKTGQAANFPDCRPERWMIEGVTRWSYASNEEGRIERIPHIAVESFACAN